MTAVDTGVEAAPKRPSGRMTARRSEALAAWLLMLPGIVLILVFIVVPFVLATIFSFTNQRLISPLPTRIVGIDNYIEQFTSSLFWTSLWNNFRFAIFVVPFQTVFALLLAILPPGAFIVTGFLIAAKNAADNAAKRRAEAARAPVVAGAKRVRVTGKIS